MTAIWPSRFTRPGRFGGILAVSLAGLFGTGCVGIGSFDTGAAAIAQTLVYQPIVTGFAPAAGPYVANYNPSGNYAAVSAFSPPVMNSVPMAAVSSPIATVVPASSVAVTSYAVPAMTTVARPVTAYYAPSYAAASPTVAAYAPSTQFYAPASGPVAVTSYYAPSYAPSYAPATVYAPPQVAVGPTVQTVQMVPATVAVPLYRRGLFGGLRPVRGAYYPAY